MRRFDERSVQQYVSEMAVALGNRLKKTSQLESVLYSNFSDFLHRSGVIYRDLKVSWSEKI